MARSFWLEHGSGVRIRVGADGILLGRDPRAQILLRDHDASRLHAWLRAGGNAVQVVALGRHATRVNDRIVSGAQEMTDGDVLSVPGASFVLGADAGEEADRPAWAIEVDGDLLLGAERAALVLGGGADDQVRLLDLPPAAASFRVIEGTLFVSLEIDGTLDGADVPADSVQELRADSTLRLGAHALVARTDGPAAGATGDSGDEPPPPTAVRLAFLPTGARLDIAFPRQAVALELSELRARLLAALLSPPKGYRPGDWVPDDVLLAAIWPRDATKTRLELNTLTHRLRKMFVGAGVHPGSVVARSRSGGATRLRLAPGADVVVE